MKKTVISIGFIMVLGVVAMICCYLIIVANASGRTYEDVNEIPHNKLGLLLATSPVTPGGAHNFDFENRIKSAEELYKAGKIDYIMASGGDYTQDHKFGCDEPMAIMDSLIARGIPADRIILDYDGTRTLNSIVKAKAVYGIDSVTLISQKYHNERAIYLADKNGLYAIGYNANPSPIRRNRIKNTVREIFARPKMFLDFIYNPNKPKFSLPKNYNTIKELLSEYFENTGINEYEQIDEMIYYSDTTSYYTPMWFAFTNPINGYKVTGILRLDKKDINYDNSLDVPEWADLFFTSDSISFKISHLTFQITDEIESEEKAFDLISFKYPEQNLSRGKVSLESISQLPFTFIDIDFDGDKELLLRHPWTGQKTICTYSAYKVPTMEEINLFRNYNNIDLDEWTEFDYSNNTIISSIWAGYDGNEKWYFKYEGDKLVPFKKEVYTEGFNKLKYTTSIK